MCMLLSATSTHFKWELMLYCLHCPTLNKVFLLLLFNRSPHLHLHYSDVKWASLLLKWPVNRVFVQQFLQTDNKKTHQRLASLTLCKGNPLITGGFPAQRDSNAENVSIWWRHNEHVGWGWCWNNNSRPQPTISVRTHYDAVVKYFGVFGFGCLRYAFSDN